ncbi:uncharacterized protein LOC108109445 [Drosophila eugracilis]|uniref:uncharacterized protein LOC108109445 n=1 Tax=Drosophila eugracilis TaxID=29029 RepID=UPI0007E80199|nr:uncharacterized protein LOC108109445 [Drosophila eugracilis]
MIKEGICLVLMLLMVDGLPVGVKRYRMTLVSFSQTNVSGVFDTSKVRLIGRERLANGTVILNEDMDDEHWSLSGQLSVDSFGDGHYKLLPFYIPITPMCQAFKKYRQYFSHHAEYGTQTDFPAHMDVCPVPKGSYYMKNVGLRGDDYPTLMQRGYYQANGTFYYDGQDVGTYTINALLEDDE